MLYDILSMRSIQVGVAFFLLVVGGSLLYSWHIHDTTEAALAETQQYLKDHENQNATRLSAVGFEPPIGLIATSEDTAPQRSEVAEAVIDDSELFEATETLVLDAFFTEALPTDVESLGAEVNADVLVSPNGFGPLPAVPVDYPNQNVWSQERLTRITPEHELLSRVRIALWNQGVRTEGAVYRTDFGQIYPTTDDVVYIQWADTPAADGKMYITEMLGTPTTINAYEEDIYRGIFPPHLKIYEFPDGGIDPYAYLGL